MFFADLAMLAIRSSEEESPEMEEMDTSESNWCWFYLAECGVWHMFEVLYISFYRLNIEIIFSNLNIKSTLKFTIFSVIRKVYGLSNTMYSKTHSDKNQVFWYFGGIFVTYTREN